MNDVTVLVTVLNMKKTIKKCVESLLKENYEKKEIWFVDGGSSDGTYEILKGYADKKKIKLFQIEGSAPVSLNWALKRIKTKYVAMTDADCVVDKNWIKNLKSAFKEKNVVASAGYCGTPKEIEGLSRIIGEELESRFKKFPDYISRAPTMNLMFLTKYGKKVMFDEKLDRAFETDFGYRLTKYGKMKYVPEAKIYHYHRTNWKSFFKQQIGYAEYALLVYKKHKDKAKGDHISTGTMILEPFCFYGIIGSVIMGFFFTIFNLLAPFFLALLLAIYTKRYFDIKPSSFWLYLIFSFSRTVGFSYGLFKGISNLFKG